MHKCYTIYNFAQTKSCVTNNTLIASNFNEIFFINIPSFLIYFDILQNLLFILPYYGLIV